MLNISELVRNGLFCVVISGRRKNLYSFNKNLLKYYYFVYGQSLIWDYEYCFFLLSYNLLKVTSKNLF
jgi:hypothetical protein